MKCKGLSLRQKTTVSQTTPENCIPKLVSFIIRLRALQIQHSYQQDPVVAFLDVMVIRDGDHLHTSVYRIPTHTDRYTPFHSHHHPRVLTGVMRCMRNRALQICDNTSKEAEMQHLETVFQANRFPEGLVKKTLSSPQATLGTSRVEDSHPEEEPPKI